MHKTLIICDDINDVSIENSTGVISFKDYLEQYPKKGEPKTRIINLCDTAQYLSKGYYCSLLAEARQHQALPSVKTINELRDISEDHSSIIDNILSLTKNANATEFLIFLGWTEDTRIQKSARKLFDLFPAPILKVTFSDKGIADISRLSITELSAEDKILFLNQLSHFTGAVWRTNKSKAQRWEMAILVNPDEAFPPSCDQALKRFVKAAKKFGIKADLVTTTDAAQILNYDALFIRETTAIDHHTYKIARKAESAGLVVLDDPDSILKCCNKVFLHDAFNYQKVPSPKTSVFMQGGDELIANIEAEYSYPIVLKMPEGSFSNGVYKVENKEELVEKLAELFELSALVLVQEYLYTDFDWRIGILNGRPIYACRYHMARNHWQIYNHTASKKFSSGDFDTLPTFEVPKAVLDAAIKSANLVGNGFYGVDLKQKDKQVYVIEVNDNPSVDHGIENAYLGDELYMLIMAEFQRRLEERGR
ncbi:RimK family protein [Pseudocolwellia sp. HL-MZ19]|uniref:RimK family protein n=1 Tax=unclassified Pseudocolwellia TaxID=2848178 RepID=UPI003CF71952